MNTPKFTVKAKQSRTYRAQSELIKARLKWLDDQIWLNRHGAALKKARGEA